MINSTLCYIEKDNKYLMLHRIRKQADVNADKWLGVGGRIEDKESPNDCVVREVKEETGVTLTKYRYRGLVTFVSDKWQTEYMHLFTATEFEGEIAFDACDEGVLEWVDKKDVLSLNLWEGDKVFLDLLEKRDSFFSVKLVYEGDKLVDSIVW